MIIKDTVLRGDGSVDVIDIEVDDNYFDPSVSDPEPTEEDDTTAMLVDHEYRLTLLELGLIE